MIYIFEDGRILYSESLLKQEDEGKYLEFQTMPEIKPVEGKVGVITGCNLETKELVIEYFDIQRPSPEPEPLLSPTEQAIMQMSVSMEYMAAMIEFNSNGGMINVS